MFQGPIVAAYELTQIERDADAEITRGPIAGIAIALPFSLALWAVLIGFARLWF